MTDISTRRLDCGRKPDPGRRHQVEECTGRLTVRAWLEGGAPADAGPFDLVETRQHREGRRRWFLCPGCGRRAGILYRPDDDDPWRCRRCHGLAYRSAQLAHRDELLWVGLKRIADHVEANAGWGDFEAWLDGMTRMQALGVCRAFFYIEAADLEERRAELEAMRGDFAVDLSHG